MVTTIYCRTTNENNDFYMVHEGKDYYLFSQNRRKGVEAFYRKAKILDKALHHGNGKRDRAIHRTMDKLRSAIRYIKNENNIIVLERTRKMRAVA